MITTSSNTNLGRQTIGQFARQLDDFHMKQFPKLEVGYGCSDPSRSEVEFEY